MNAVVGGIQLRHAQAERDVQRSVSSNVKPAAFDLRTNALRALQSLIEVSIRQQDDKLLATKACRQIAVATAGFQNPGDVPQVSLTALN